MTLKEQCALPSLLIGFLCLVSLGAKAQDLPVDTHATKETISLYRNLKALASRGFLFGHQDDLAYGVGWKYLPGRSDIKDVTGDYPALYGWELGRLELDHAVNIDSVPFDKMKQYIREGYRRGGVITISWHLNNPLTGGTAWQPAPGTVASILPGGAKNELYKSWLDKVADFMLSLKGDHGEYIPVIFRLFHELNGSWFWWGGHNCTPDELRQLWHFTVSYLRDKRRVHNLLYAYNTDKFSSAGAWLEKYPGDEWADVAGFDVYQRGDNAAFATEFGQMLTTLEAIASAHNKIPAVTEFGYNGLPDSTWWTATFLQTLRGHHIGYVMAWRNAGDEPGGHHEFYVPFKGQASAADFIKFHSDPGVLFQEAVTTERLYYETKTP
jgi:Glycosyl hydrolase family 26